MKRATELPRPWCPGSGQADDEDKSLWASGAAKRAYVAAGIDSEKLVSLEAAVASWTTVAVAYSGGVDSTLLAWILGHVVGKQIHLYLVKSPFLANREEMAAHTVAGTLGFSLSVLSVDPLAEQAVRANPPDRCYHCKAIMTEAIDRHRPDGAVVVDGSHADDALEDRPGRKALMERGVRSPFALSGWTKEDIRRVARLAGLPNDSKPSQSCLATRVPYGTPLEAGILKRIEVAEDFLYRLGCTHVRVRWQSGDAKIQVGSADRVLLSRSTVWERLLGHMAKLGFARTILDPAPLRSD